MLGRLSRLPIARPRGRLAHSLPAWATVNPWTLSKEQPHTVQNYVDGQWFDAKAHVTLPDPMNGDPFIRVPNPTTADTQPFVDSLKRVPKTGLHNPFKNPERYLKMGDVSYRAAAALRDPQVIDFFVKLIQRVAPKSEAQALGEVKVTRMFLENFSGDQVRFLARSFGVPGDHNGQMTHGFRWPYGPVAIISPFNFPLEIPMLQIMGALFMGNKVLFKPEWKVAIVMEQCLRMLLDCGLPPTDVDLLNCDGPVIHDVLMRARPRMTQFTGSSRVAELLAKDLSGKIKIEDAGFDWKVLGPDVHDFDYVAYTCDQDAYAFSGQKCSAQSILIMHENWEKAGLVDKLRDMAARRNLQDLTLGPVLTVTNERFLAHVDALKKIPGAKVLFGGDLLDPSTHKIPAVYGSFQPTAVYVPLEQLLKPEHFGLCTTEIFGPFQIVTTYKDNQLDSVIEALERMDHHLTAAIVSKDSDFQQKLLANTVNGTTYCGIRARTTGAPQNHWFGPAGDPRGAGIGSPEAIKLVWSCHREVIMDVGPVPAGWTVPQQS